MFSHLTEMSLDALNFIRISTFFLCVLIVVHQSSQKCVSFWNSCLFFYPAPHRLCLTLTPLVEKKQKRLSTTASVIAVPQLISCSTCLKHFFVAQ